MATCRWGSHTFNVYDTSTEGWRDVAGLYIFARLMREGRWRAIYIGETGSFKHRMADHERLDEALRRGTTHIHAMVFPGEETARQNLEQGLIREFRPELQPRS